MAEPVALGIKPPQGMSLGDMLNIARGAQAYQQEQQMNPLALEKARAEAQVATGTVTPRISQATSEAETSRINALKANYGLDDTEHSAFAKILGGFAYDPRLSPEAIKKNPQGVLEVIHDMKAEGRASGIRDKRLDTITAPAMAKALQDPSSVPQYLQNMMTRGMTPSEQRSAGIEKLEVTPTGQVMRTTPTVYGQKPQVTFEKPKGEVPANETIESDPLGNKAIVKRDTSGQVISSRPVPSGTQGGFQTLPQGETPDTVAKARAEQLAIQDVAKGVQASQFNNNTIIGLADKALVGANAETLAKFGGGFAIMDAIGTGSLTAVDNRQKLGHILAQETKNLSSSAGLNTDAARSLSSQISGDIQWTPEAIKSTARTNRALSTGADMLNRGMTIAIKNANNNPIAGRDFQNKWSTQEQLLPTLQFIDSMRNAKSDPEGAKKMIDSVGGYGSQGYKDMLKRAGGLNDLITKGQ
jgi:hypothetical protein